MTTYYSNNASTTLSANLAIGATAANVTDDTAFPAVSSPDYFFATLEDLAGNIEIVKVTNHVAASNTFTITRAQDGTIDQGWVSGDLIQIRLVREALNELRDHNHSGLYGEIAATQTWTGTNTYSGTLDVTGTFNISGANVTSTAAEINALDGGNVPTSATVDNDDGVVMNIDGVVQQVDVDNLDTYLSQTTKALTNKTLTNPTITSPTIDFIVDSNGNVQLDFVEVVSATNFLELHNNSTGLEPSIRIGGEANIGMVLYDSNDQQTLSLPATASAVNWVGIANRQAGVAPVIYSLGETDIGLNVQGDGGNGPVYLNGTAATHKGNGFSGRVLIESVTASASASVEFATDIDSTYDKYIIEYISVIPATNAVDMEFAVSTDAGVSWEDDGAVSNYRHGVSNDALVNVFTSVHNFSTYGCSGELHIYSPANTSVNTQIMNVGMFTNTSLYLEQSHDAWAWQSIAAVNGFRIRFDTGNIASGEFRLYGVSA